AFVLYPDKVMEILGLREASTEEPITEVVDEQPVKEVTKLVVKQPKVIKEQPKEIIKEQPKEIVKEVVVKTYTEDSKAMAQINKAQNAYENFEWTNSRNLANKIIKMDASPKVKTKARQLITNSKQLQAFMKKMTSKLDGMVRGIYISEALAALHMQNGGDPILVVPIKSLNNHDIIKTKDGAEYIQTQLDATGKVFCMTEKGIAAEYKSTRILEVKNPDRASITKKNQTNFKEKNFKVESNEFLKNDAVALYEVARYGYFVGADKKVTALLERAILIDPALSETVRNDRARGIFDKLVRFMKKNPEGRSAAGFVAQLKKHYSDTPVYPEAVAYYKGDKARVAKLQQEENQRKKEERKRAREEAKRQAEKEGNKERLDIINTIEEEEQAEEASVAAVSGDEAKADAAWEQGSEYLRVAIMEAPDDGTKDKMLKKAFNKINEAYNIYSKLAEEGNQSALSKLPECGQDKYLAKKTMRPIW
ncbi:MAG: hypothetical protein HRU15_17105, partial [Planctomycetes bacterium]|nr:hypothetical protein [Planctomycetota bacterium]